mgnify:CR=1 FL=1
MGGNSGTEVHNKSSISLIKVNGKNKIQHQLLSLGLGAKAPLYLV